MSEELHILAREEAARLNDGDKKQLRFNEIVECAIAFYRDPKAGVSELVQSCDRSSPLYVKGRSMAQALFAEYAWMKAGQN